MRITELAGLAGMHPQDPLLGTVMDSWIEVVWINRGLVMLSQICKAVNHVNFCFLLGFAMTRTGRVCNGR